MRRAYYTADPPRTPRALNSHSRHSPHLSLASAGLLLLPEEVDSRVTVTLQIRTEMRGGEKAKVSGWVL